MKIWEPHLTDSSKVTVWDLMTLPTDPTPEELKEMRDQQVKAREKQFEAIKERYRKNGINV